VSSELVAVRDCWLSYRDLGYDLAITSSLSPLSTNSARFLIYLLDMTQTARHSRRVASAKPAPIIPVERIASRIYRIRGENVMLDADLAELYGVPTKRLNEQVTRNLERFPPDFLFELTAEEFDDLRSQIATSSWGGRRYLPRAFTEQVAMLSSVLRSKPAVQVNVAIVRTFVRLRRLLHANEQLARKVAEHDQQIAVLFEHVRTLLEPSEPPDKPRIGFAPARQGS
jgi:hypothetical protein